MRIDGSNGLAGAARETDLPVRPGAPVNQPGPSTEPDQTPQADDAVDTVEISDQARELLAHQPAQNTQSDAVEHVRQFMMNKSYNDQGLLEETARNIAPVLLAEA